MISQDTWGWGGEGSKALVLLLVLLWKVVKLGKESPYCRVEGSHADSKGGAVSTCHQEAPFTRAKHEVSSQKNRPGHTEEPT